MLEFLRMVQNHQLPRAPEQLLWLKRSFSGPQDPESFPTYPLHPWCPCKRDVQHSFSVVDLLQTIYRGVMGYLRLSTGVGSPVQSSSSLKAQMQTVPSVLAQC